MTIFGSVKLQADILHVLLKKELLSTVDSQTKTTNYTCIPNGQSVRAEVPCITCSLIESCDIVTITWRL